MNECDYAALIDNLRESVPDFRLFEAVCLDGYTAAELSASLGVCAHTVYRRVRRVRQLLQGHLPPDLPIGSDNDTPLYPT